MIRLHPLAQVELRKQEACFLRQLFSANFKPVASERMGLALAELVVAGGFPAALTRPAVRRRAWYQAYVQTLVQRDVRDLARIAALDVMPRLLELAAGQTAHLFNVSELAGPFGLSRPTVRDYLTLLEQGAVLAGVEVKASGTVRSEDFRGLRKLQEIAGERFACGVVLYDGEASLRFGPRLFALPMRTLWSDRSGRGFAWPG